MSLRVHATCRMTLTSLRAASELVFYGRLAVLVLTVWRSVDVSVAISSVIDDIREAEEACV